MKNHWVKAYKRKQNHWWTVEFSSNGLFLLKTRHVRIPTSVKDLLCDDSDEENDMSVIFLSSAISNEVTTFLQSARQSMVNMYARLRVMDGIFPVAIERRNYELTGLDYTSVHGGWASSDVQFDFTCQHIRQYILK